MRKPKKAVDEKFFLDKIFCSKILRFHVFYFIALNMERNSIWLHNVFLFKPKKTAEINCTDAQVFCVNIKT